MSVDSLDHNSDMVGKLVLPFPLLSDARGELTKLFDLWNDEEGVAVPTIIVIDRTGDIRYLYTGDDFADRPGDAEIFASLDALDDRGSGYVGGEPAVRLQGAEARESVRPDRPPMTLGQLVPYYRGALFATIALKKRFGGWGKSGRDAFREVGRYQEMVKEYGGAIRKTTEMRRGE